MKVAVAPAAALLAALSTAAGLSMADRTPTPEERTRIMQALDNLGFDTFGEIEIEGSRIEVDDALHRDGRRYDIDLDATTLELLAKQESDQDDDD